jgi:hypothetical protein
MVAFEVGTLIIGDRHPAHPLAEGNRISSTACPQNSAVHRRSLKHVRAAAQQVAHGARPLWDRACAPKSVSENSKYSSASVYPQPRAAHSAARSGRSSAATTSTLPHRNNSASPDRHNSCQTSRPDVERLPFFGIVVISIVHTRSVAAGASSAWFNTFAIWSRGMPPSAIRVAAVLRRPCARNSNVSVLQRGYFPVTG